MVNFDAVRAAFAAPKPDKPTLVETPITKVEPKRPRRTAIDPDLLATLYHVSKGKHFHWSTRKKLRELWEVLAT